MEGGYLPPGLEGGIHAPLAWKGGAAPLAWRGVSAPPPPPQPYIRWGAQGGSPISPLAAPLSHIILLLRVALDEALPKFRCNHHHHVVMLT
jgi:hypothetical protein